jgi:dCTP deaminase
MSFWSTEKLIQTQAVRTLIDPFDQQFAKHGAYELSLGSEVFITTERKETKQTLAEGEQLIIPPGQFGLLLTEEIVSIPNNAIGFISVRFTKKRRGLVNVSGFHVDPGFSGRLKFAVYNAGSQKIVLTRGERVFMIWFSDLSEATADTYKGTNFGLKEITSEDVMSLQGEVASPAELKRQIEELGRSYEQRFATLDNRIAERFSTLENKMNERFSGMDDKITTWRGITIAVLTVLGFGILIVVLRESLHSPTTPPTPTTIESTRSREPVHDTNLNQPAPGQLNGNAANTASPQPKITPRAGN